MEQTKITEMRNRRISALSKGYKQRVGIAQALLGDPKVIILDEPTVGLDPIQIIEIRDLIKELGQHRTVIFSSHILSEVQTICDEIMIISHGKLVALGEPEKLMHDLLTPNEITITAEADKEKVDEILSGITGITETVYSEHQESEACTTVRIKTDLKEIYDMSRQLFKAFAGSDVVLLEMALKQVNLEDVFLELTEDTPAESTSSDEEVPEATGEESPAETTEVHEESEAEEE